ncbi:hypothetical protein BH747_09905 [Enterococcus villorum]|uniref:CBM-cenC domain-containing protein n=1 Tax=Enterococcus villorum TaxID=112904 RepID=A0A1V8YAF8_9ENTE|nr:hypothetical protein [Enterococcus villorum]OQO69575.1 hypothetical protein BH747_09905 [Enterococcus villorum]OQO72673.1 hypothetical protein BH744_11195 [Enterococcus villorum]
MKKNILKKIATTSILCISLGGPVVTFASDQTSLELANLSKQVLEEKLAIKNGEFNDDLNHWIVSNPGTENPTIEEVNGNKYVLAKYGENIHQYLSLMPDTTYTVEYDVAGSENFPAKVEFGTMNHGEGFVSLEKVEHDNEKWTRQTFSFTTLKSENSYIIRFSSTGNGWAKFDNIQVEPESSKTNLLTVGTKSRQAFVSLNLNDKRFNSSERLMVYVDGKYHFETYKGVAYYSFINKKDENIQVSRNIAGKKGQVLQVYTAPRKPGESSEGKQLLESITLEADLPINVFQLENAVKDIHLTGNRLVVDFDRESFYSDNRMIVRKNGKYIAEVYNGKHYYSIIRSTTADNVRITKDMDFKAGDIISVELSNGLPGSASNSLQILKTFEVK